MAYNKQNRVYVGIRMCKDDPCNYITLHFSNYDQYHHQYRWLTFGFPATDGISLVTFVVNVSNITHSVVKLQKLKH
jgi:hypothetical protein